MAYRSRESLLKSGYQSMDIDDENLELLVKSSSEESQNGEENLQCITMFVMAKQYGSILRKFI